MNHLAHLFLAGPSVESLIGNISGDFVKGPLRGQLEPAIEQGITEHRRIDSFTDTHPEVAGFRRILVPDHGHYARAIADVFLDHFLACDFPIYADTTLEDFVTRTFARLDPHIQRMPPRLQVAYPRMRDDRWLLSYRTIDGIHTALYWMSRRFSRKPRLEAATALLTTHREALHGHFRAFMPDVIEFARHFTASRSS
jgi:acyl carrier protein phosphodiesterase